MLALELSGRTLAPDGIEGDGREKAKESENNGKGSGRDTALNRLQGDGRWAKGLLVIFYFAIDGNAGWAGCAAISFGRRTTISRITWGQANPHVEGLVVGRTRW